LVCLANVCQAPSCSDAVQNQNETDTDCGGACGNGCAVGKKCLSASDCATFVCKAGTCQDVGLTVAYYARDTQAGDAFIGPSLKIVNGGSFAVPYSELTIRYYYTNDNASYAEGYGCGTMQKLSCANLTLAFAAMSPAKTNADRTMQLGFASAAGTLAAGADSGEIGLVWHKGDLSLYDEGNDYSADLAVTSFTARAAITLYRNGALVWGTEPPD
jgi:hypothetical protein